MEKKGESLIRQDRGCRPPGDPISPIPGDECVLLCPLLGGVLHYRPRTKPLNSRALAGPYSPIRLQPFSCIDVRTIGTSLPNMLIKLALRLRRTSFNRWAPIFTRMVS
ncbi:hypothetical protein AVEN_237348-1 [Araneus ventricosus]|uniref:Uncharacterized protein n=1 Tax=Araneus ventricosus TaxID=182803 RepID=A0A4Y2WPH9_ARAVE|nr:hypothetical protein AVEN_237348-1 [Araneus ventricosus]